MTAVVPAAPVAVLPLVGRLATPSGEPEDELPSRRGTLLAAALCVISLGGGLLGWTLWARIDSAVVAQGQVVVDGRRKTVQHLEGGILRELLVREGDRVEAGQALARLDPVQADAQSGELEDRLLATRARVERLTVERAGGTRLAWSADLLRAAGATPARRVLDGQEELFLARRLAHESEIGSLERQIGQMREEAVSASRQREALRRQHASLEHELAGVRRLLAKGWERRNRADDLDRRLAELDGRDAELAGAAARAGQGIEAARLGIENKRQARLAQVGQDLDEAQAEEAATASRLRAARDVRDRLVVASPQAGIVVDLRLVTPGGVLGPGEPLLDVVPEDDPLLVEARLQPSDIDSVRAGQPADVRLVAYKGSEAPTLLGELTYVSADLLADPRDGTQHFLARVRLDPASLAAYPRVALTPGMPAEVMVRTGERRAIDWLLAPLTDRLRRAMREE